MSDVIYELESSGHFVDFEVITHTSGTHPWFYKQNINQVKTLKTAEIVEKDVDIVYESPNLLMDDKLSRKSYVEIANETDPKKILDFKTVFQEAVIEMDHEEFHEAVNEHNSRKRKGRKRSAENSEKTNKKVCRNDSVSEIDPLESKEDSEMKKLQHKLKTLQLALDTQNNLILEKSQTIKYFEKKLQDVLQEKLKEGCGACKKVEVEMQKREAESRPVKYGFLDPTLQSNVVAIGGSVIAMVALCLFWIFIHFPAM